MSDGTGKIDIDPDFQFHRLLTYMFREYAAEDNLTTEDLVKVSPVKFVTWVREYMVTLSAPDLDLLLTDLHITRETFDFVQTRLQDPFSSSVFLQAMWPMLTLSGQPPLKNKIKFLHVSISLGFEDEQLVQFVVPTYARAELPFTNALLVSCLQAQVRDIITSIAEHGADALHEQHARPVTSLVTEEPKATKADIRPAFPGTIAEDFNG